MKKRLTAFILAAASFILCACSRVSGPVDAPFAPGISWDLDSARLEAVWGKCDAPYTSIYNGLTYSYPCEYLGRDGTVKFMFSDKGRLASVAWTFLTDSEEELNSVYTEVENAEKEKNGAGNVSESSGAVGNVWYTKDKDILLTSVGVNGSYGFQYSYISRDFSKRNLAK